MSLLDAPQFDEKKETRNRNLLIGSGVTILVLAIVAVAGFILGHGWFFMNLPAEHHVKVFLGAVEAGDYPKAYGIWYNDPDWQQHPDKYKDYPLQRFTEDFSTASDWKGPVKTFHVDFSKRDSSGVVVESTIDGSTPLTLKLQKADGTLTFFPYELTRGVF